VSFAEISQRLAPDELVAWKGFLGVGDPVLGPLARESLQRLREITQRRGETGTPEDRRGFGEWIADAIAPRNIAGLAQPERRNIYPLDFDALIERHALLGMGREQILAALPMLRGMAPAPFFTDRGVMGRSRSLPDRPTPARDTLA